MQLNSPYCCVKQFWKQRLIVPTATGITVTVHDYGGFKMLINLCPNHDFSGPIKLADLFQTWHKALGMSTALLDTPNILCCQFERLNAASTRRDNPIHFVESCQVPIFCGPNINVDWMEFTTSGNGFPHWQRSQWPLSNCLLDWCWSDPFWLLLDNHRIATSFNANEDHQGLPVTFLRGVTLIWLCKSDCL